MLIGLLGGGRLQAGQSQLLMAGAQGRMARVLGIGTDRFGDGVCWRAGAYTGPGVQPLAGGCIESVWKRFPHSRCAPAQRPTL